MIYKSDIRWWIILAKRKLSGLYVNDKLKEKLQTCLYSEGKTLKGALLEEANYIIDNDIPIEKPVEDFLNIREKLREKLIEKYGTLKNAADSVGMNPNMLRNTLHFLETKKKYRPQESTISMLSKLLAE